MGYNTGRGGERDEGQHGKHGIAEEEEEATRVHSNTIHSNTRDIKLMAGQGWGYNTIHSKDGIVSMGTPLPNPPRRRKKEEEKNKTINNQQSNGN